MFRLFRHALGVAVAAVLVVSLGVGATTAIFSVVYRVNLPARRAALSPPAESLRGA